MTFRMTSLAMLWGLVAVTVGMPASADAGDAVGVRRMAVLSQERGLALDVTVWYPASGGRPVTLGESRFFVGTPAMLDASIAAGRFPLVVLSHGAGLAGTAPAMGWIAAPLARRGFVVAAPTHPGNGGAQRSAAETMKLWLRPADLTETVTAMVQAPFFAAHLAPGKIGALGLSMGGGTVLALAGARMDAARLAGYCDTDALNPSLCDWIRHSGVDLHAMDLSPAGRDHRDARIRFVMAIDPAPVDVFAVDSFSRISVPVDLVNLGTPETIPLTAQAATIAKAIPHAAYAAIVDASHYSMFAECKPGVADHLDVEDIGDPICTDGGGRPRGDIHAELIERVAAAFGRAFKSSR